MKTKGIASTLYTEFNTTTNEGLYIHGYACNDWLTGNIIVFGIKILISVLIVAFNYILRQVIIMLVKWIG